MPKIADVVNRCPNRTMGPIHSLGLILTFYSHSMIGIFDKNLVKSLVLSTWKFRIKTEDLFPYCPDCPKRSKHRNPCCKHGPPFFWVLLPHCLPNERDKKCWIRNCTAWSQDQNKAKQYHLIEERLHITMTYSP